MKTTSFAALVAGVGIAIGAAWGGLPSNFAAGAFLTTLRPFKVGDYVAAGGVEGTVEQLAEEAVARLRSAVARVVNVLVTPAPDVAILSFNERGPVLAVRPYCDPAHCRRTSTPTGRFAKRSARPGTPFPRRLR